MRTLKSPLTQNLHSENPNALPKIEKTQRPRPLSLLLSSPFPCTTTPMPPHRKRSSSAVSSSPCKVEFRATNDDAWYDVSLRVEEGKVGGEAEGHTETYLRVMYSGFSEIWDERIPMRRFQNLNELEEFWERFRSLSMQLQDLECWKVIEGMVVCASYPFDDKYELKFYDAVVESVCDSEHKFVDGEEVCSCAFALIWQHGPNTGSIRSAGIENICLIQDSSASDPALLYFLELSRKKLEAQQGPDGNRELTNEKEQNGHHPILRPPPGYEDSPIARNCKANIQSEGIGFKHGKHIGHDMDLGGHHLPEPNSDSKDDFYFIWIENLEKDLLPEKIVDFIYQQTSVVSQAWVFPALCSESYVRGTIYVDTREKTVKLSKFLIDPSLVIMSARGRPWVITEKKWHFGSLGGLIPKVERRPPAKIDAHSNKIKVVREGDVEFEKSKQLHQLFLEFHEHVQGLHKRLASEERKVMQSNAQIAFRI